MVEWPLGYQRFGVFSISALRLRDTSFRWQVVGNFPSGPGGLCRNTDSRTCGNNPPWNRINQPGKVGQFFKRTAHFTPRTISAKSPTDTCVLTSVWKQTRTMKYGSTSVGKATLQLSRTLYCKCCKVQIPVQRLHRNCSWRLLLNKLIEYKALKIPPCFLWLDLPISSLCSSPKNGSERIEPLLLP